MDSQVRLPTISILVAMANNRVIGRDGDLPWHISDDLKRFKQLTMGHTIVMGRKTYDSIGRPLPGRRSIVISRNIEYEPDGVEVVSSFEQALGLTAVAGEEEIFVIGGAMIYKKTLPLANRLYLTRIDATVEGDVRFPWYDKRHWREIDNEPTQTDPKSGLRYQFLVYERSVL